MKDMEDTIEKFKGLIHSDKAWRDSYSIGSLIKDQFLSPDSTLDQTRLVEHILSYRWGQDNGADVDKLSAIYEDDYTMFNGS
jgi:hypothetical protein